MKFYWIPLIVVLVINLVIDLLIYCKLKKSKRWPRKSHLVHAGACVALYGMLAASFVTLHSKDLSVAYVGMYLLCMFYVIQAVKVVSLAVYSLSWMKRMAEPNRRFVRMMSAVVGSIVLLKCLWGIVMTPYELEVHHVTVASDRVPAAFDGYTIVQFSDVHLGTYGNDTKFMAQCVDSVNALNPDLICLTGDLVNRNSTEADIFVPVLKQLKAKDGVLSVRGNHDEGRYYRWDNEQQRLVDSARLDATQIKMGMKPLVDKTVVIRRGGDSIMAIGNSYTCDFDAEHGFLKKHILKACPDYATNKAFKIMLQHTPKVWKYVKETGHTDLMLSGHTHGMQMLFYLFGMRYSPASMMYDNWGGLTNDGNQYLYVSTGVGEVGVPMRIGLSPEITVITLRKK